MFARLPTRRPQGGIVKVRSLSQLQSQSVSPKDFTDFNWARVWCKPFLLGPNGYTKDFSRSCPQSGVAALDGNPTLFEVNGP
jgi:hypothetical protein